MNIEQWDTEWEKILWAGTGPHIKPLFWEQREREEGVLREWHKNIAKAIREVKETKRGQ